MGGSTAGPATAPLLRDTHDLRRPPGPLVVVAIAVAGGIAAVASYRLSLAGDYGRAPHLHAALVAWVTVAYVLCGLIAWSRRPESRFGPLMVASGFAPAVSRLAEADTEVFQAIGEGLLLLPPVMFIHVFLAYPDGHVEGRFATVLVAAGYIAALGIGLMRAILILAGRSTAADASQAVQRVAVVAFAVGALVVLIRRRRSSGRRLWISRKLLIGCFALALVGLAAGIFMKSIGAPGTGPMRWIVFALVGAAPVLLLVGHLRARLARSAVGDLFVELRGTPGPAQLQDALSRALGDASLRLVYWLPEFGTFADADGRAVKLPGPGESQVATVIERDGVRVAALLHDAALTDEPELLDAARAAAGLALENAQLHVELRARLEELRGSRVRILEATHEERRRLERDLHDGAQQRLVALSLELSLLEEALKLDEKASARVGEAREEVAASLGELRELARGIHPAVVSGHGLGVALEQLAARAGVPVRLVISVGRLPESVEIAAYFVVAESLANVDKYARASSATVDVKPVGRLLVVEVVDDGVGGADTERGSGLRGLADRVEALGGRLRVWSPVGAGTRVKAEIPCA